MTLEIIVTEILLQLGIVALAFLLALAEVLIQEKVDENEHVPSVSTIFSTGLTILLLEALFYGIVR